MATKKQTKTVGKLTEVKKKEEKKEIKKSIKPVKVTVEALFEAGAHFGHVAKRWNPKMEKYLYGKRGGTHIFDLEKTVEKLEEAKEALTRLASEGKRIALVGTKRQAKAMVIEEAVRAGIPYVSERWLGGTVTNWVQFKSRVDRMKRLEADREAGKYAGHTKKERLLIDREIAKLRRLFGGLAELTAAPEVLVITDAKKERTAVREATRKGLIVVGIVDSNIDPDLITYPIPMNDDSVSAMGLVVRDLVKAIEAGMVKRKKGLAIGNKGEKKKNDG